MPRRSVPDVCRILCRNVLGLAENLSDPTVASSQYDILLWSETLVSDMCHASENLDSGALSCCAGIDASGPRDGCIRGRWLRSIFECGCCKMLVFRVCGVRQNLYVFSL